MRQNKNTFLQWRIRNGSDWWIWKKFADQDWIGFIFIGSGLDSEWKISQSAQLWCCSDSGYNFQSNLNFPMFLLKKWPHRFLLLLKLKSDSGSGSVFSQIFDSGSGSKWKTQNPAGGDAGYSDPAPPLVCSLHQALQSSRLFYVSLHWLAGYWMIPGQVAFFFLIYDVQHCCFVTLTC